MGAAALRSVALSLLLALLACQPDAAGRCSSAAECHGGALCAIDGICILASAQCSLVCTAGQLCSADTCVTLKPNVVIAPGTTAWLTQGATVTVHVDAAPELTLGALTLTVSAGGATVAQGTLQKAQAGDNLVSISALPASTQERATLVADLSYPGADGALQDAVSPSVSVGIDTLAPTLQIVLPAPGDAVAGWVPRAGPDLLVKAQVVDSDTGSGPASAALELTDCPAHASVPCRYTGVAEGAASQGLVTYDFAVPRAVQVAGSEGKIAFKVTAADVAGNTTDASGALQIDDAAPQLGGASLATAGVAGENGETWFAGASAPVQVDLVLPAADDGAGLVSDGATLALAGADLGRSNDLLIPAVSGSGADGKLHFLVDTSVVSGSEARVHWTATVKDRLGHAAVLAASEQRVVDIDDAAPLVSLARIDYAGAQPAFASVCARAEVAACTATSACTQRGFHCGRGVDAGHADHALRDDTVSAVFDVLDCGAGVASAGATFLAESGGVATQAAPAVDDGKPVAGSCPTGALQNKLHHFTLTLPLGALGSLDDSDASGATRVRLAQAALDRMGLAGASADLTGSSPDGDGVVLVSLVRWRAQLGGAASGAPALLPAASAGAARTVVAGGIAILTATGSAPNLYLLDSAGAETAAVSVTGGIGSDIAVGVHGALYMPGTTHSCNGNSGGLCVALQLASFPNVAVSSCSDEKPGIRLGAPLVLGAPASGSVFELATAVATARNSLTDDDAFTFQPGASLSCAKISHGVAALGDATQTPTGVAAAGGTVYISSAAGFTSVASTGANFSGGVIFSDAGSTALPAPPALPPSPSGSGLEPIFGAFSALSPSSGAELRSATASTCTVLNTPCWQSGPLTLSPLAVSHTPLYLSLGSSAAIFATTDTGQVVALSFGGVKLGDTTTPVTDPANASKPFVSPPLLLGAGESAPETSPLVVLQGDGKLRLVQFPVQGSSTAPVIDRTLVAGLGAWAAGTRPQTPVADARGTGSVVYVVDGGCPASRTGCGPSWLWAVQLDVPPRAASANAWTRPGHDSCNTRNANADPACP